MSATIATTANQAYKKYKEGGGTLSFKEFLNRDKAKMFAANGEDSSLFMIKPQLNDTVQTAIDKMMETGGLKKRETGNTVFGINKYLVIGGAVAATGIIIYLIVKAAKK